MNRKRLSSLLLVSALLMLPAASIANAASPASGNGGGIELDGGDSPEDVFERAKLAAETNDGHAFFRLLPPETRLQIGFFMVTGTRMALGMKARMEGGDASEHERELDALLKSHGVKTLPENTPQIDLNDSEAVAAAARYTLEGVDVFLLLEDLQSFMSRLGFSGGSTKMTPTARIEGGLTNLKIEGDHATATVDGKEGHFQKVNGRWYIVPESNN
jgi:hypothetical protein